MFFEVVLDLILKVMLFPMDFAKIFSVCFFLFPIMATLSIKHSSYSSYNLICYNKKLS